LENWSTLQDLFGDDIYQNKKNSLKENLDLKKIFEWQEFLEKDDSEQAEKYLNKLKYLYRVFSERELVEIFK
jgi:mannose-1-phosphate guanylyltransferase